MDIGGPIRLVLTDSREEPVHNTNDHDARHASQTDHPKDEH